MNTRTILDRMWSPYLAFQVLHGLPYLNVFSTGASCSTCVPLEYSHGRHTLSGLALVADYLGLRHLPLSSNKVGEMKAPNQLWRDYAFLVARVPCVPAKRPETRFPFPDHSPCCIMLSHLSNDMT
jgi:hypothetical protein